MGREGLGDKPLRPWPLLPSRNGQGEMCSSFRACCSCGQVDSLQGATPALTADHLGNTGLHCLTTPMSSCRHSTTNMSVSFPVAQDQRFLKLGLIPRCLQWQLR